MSLFSWTSLLFWGIHLTRLTIPRRAEFIRVISFFFSLRSLRGIILEFGFLSYPKLRSWFYNVQRQLLMRLHPMMNERQLSHFRSLKIYHMLIFSGIFLDTKYGQGVRLSADTYIANREWGPPMSTSPCNDIGGEGEIASPASIILLTTIVCWFLPVTITRWRPNVFGCHISS